MINFVTFYFHALLTFLHNTLFVVGVVLVSIAFNPQKELIMS